MERPNRIVAYVLVEVDQSIFGRLPPKSSLRIGVVIQNLAMELRHPSEVVEIVKVAEVRCNHADEFCDFQRIGSSFHVGVSEVKFCFNDILPDHDYCGIKVGRCNCEGV